MSLAQASLPALGLSNKAMETISETALEHPPFEEDLMQNTLWPEVSKLYGHGYEMACVASDCHSNSAKIVATACKASRPDHAAIRLWSTSTWAQIGHLEAHTLTVTDMCFSPDSKYLLSVGRDRAWTLFENKEGTFVQVARDEKAHSRVIWRCAFSQDGKFFATCSRDKLVKIWSVSSEPEFVGQVKLDESITSVALTKIDKEHVMAVGTESGNIEVHCAADAANWRRLLIVDSSQAPNGVVRRLCFFKNKLAACSEDHSVRVYTLNG
jgi:elongator complex protein 2